MNDGMPRRATRSPFTAPTSTPERSATITASQPSPYSLNSTANMNPENAMTEGNDRSISPAPMTNVSPIDSKMSGGRVDRNVM